MSADLNIMSRLHHYSPDSSPLESLAAIAVSEPPALPSRHSSGPPLAVHLQQQHSPLLPTWLCTFSPVVNRWCVWVTWAAGSKNRASNLAQNAPLRHRPSQYIYIYCIYIYIHLYIYSLIIHALLCRVSPAMCHELELFGNIPTMSKLVMD